MVAGIYGKKRKRGGAADGIYCSRRKYSKGVASTLLSSRKWKPTPRRVYFNVYSLGSYNGTTSYVIPLSILKKNCFRRQNFRRKIVNKCTLNLQVNFLHCITKCTLYLASKQLTKQASYTLSFWNIFIINYNLL